jgi:hypothetical protein
MKVKFIMLADRYMQVQGFKLFIEKRISTFTFKHVYIYFIKNAYAI